MILSTKTIALTLLAGVLALGAVAHGSAQPAPQIGGQIVEGSGQPILLARMVVTAPALPAE